MAGVAGSTDISGTNAAISGTSDKTLNPIGTITYNGGDTVSQIDYYSAIAFAGTDKNYEIGLYALNAGAANGATKVWGKVITVANGALGWISVPVSNEAITATDGDTLAVALSSASGGSGNVTFKQGSTATSKSHAASGATLLSTWTETTTTTRQMAITVTTVPESLTPTLTSGTPTGTVDGSFTAGFTTDTDSGTGRIVIDSAANLTGVTATQVLAGQRASGAAAAYDSGDITVTDTSPDYAFSGVSSGVYTLAAAQDAGDESNVLTWTLTVDATAPTFSVSPNIAAIAATTATIGGTSNEAATAYVVATAAGASQPADATFEASAFTDEVEASVGFLIALTGLTALSLYRFWVQLVDAVGNRTTESVLGLTSPTGYSRVTIVTPNADPDLRLTSTADIASGDVVAWGDVVGTGSVIVYDDASFEADAGVTAFAFYVGNTTDGWGASETQTIEGVDEIAPSVTSVSINSLGTTFTLQCDEAVVIGAGGNGGLTLSMSGGAVTATYSSGASSSSLVYTLSRTISIGETGTVTYTQPTNGIEDEAGNDLASFGPTVVTNNSAYDGIPATVDSAVVATDGDSISFDTNEQVTIGAGGNGGFTISMSGGACTLTYSSGSGSSSLVYTTSRTIKAVETGTASYTQPGNGVEDAWGQDTSSFSGLVVTNLSTVNSPPTDISLSRSRVRVDAGINAVVGTLSTVDPDSGDSFTYTLVAGVGDTDNASFSINDTQLLCDDPAVLGVGTYSVRIQTDDGTDTFSKAFSIEVQVATPTGPMSVEMSTSNMTGPMSINPF